ncbi:PRC-barrel domain-containing protein [Palleronia sp.]|uniref:PRC-barrel domain-containing protein n=1 Tax=Palleronia sp. TaxID=1940284 RepID=UPI0035C7A1A7
MKRILSTSALTILLASGTAYAQQTTQGGEIFATVPAEPSMLLGTDYIGQNVYSTMGYDASAQETNGLVTDAETEVEGTATGALTEGEAEVEQETVATQSQPENVGEISDIIMTQDGQVEYVILGVGGFLGIGQQDVAVNFDALSVQPDPQNEGEMMIMINATQEQIENAPTFDRSIYEGVARDGSATMQSTETEAETVTTTVTQEPAEEAAAETEATVESTMDQTEQTVEGAANEAGQALEGAANETEQALEGAAQSAGNAASEAASEAGQAVEQTGDAIENPTDEAAPAN